MLRLAARSLRAPVRCRAASTLPSGITSVPSLTENGEPDPQLEGLGYPLIKGSPRQLRPAKAGWWDEQERIQPDEVLPENEDVQNMWAPDIHPNFPGTQALRYFATAVTVMAGVIYTIYLTMPERPLEARTYPYDGLKSALLGKDDDSNRKAARPNPLEEDEE